MSFPYVLVVLFGAATIALEASRKFSSNPVGKIDDSYPVLKHVELSNLAPRSHYVAAGSVYISGWLMVYAAILSFSELYEFVINGPLVDQAGATGLPSFEKHLLSITSRDGENLAKPLIISTVIVFVISTGVFASLERLFRALSHSLAGIPKGIYRIISQLNRIDYDSINLAEDSSLAVIFSKNITSSNIDASQPHFASISSDLHAIDVLSPATVGRMRDVIWPIEETCELGELIIAQRSEIDELKMVLEQPVGDSDSSIGILQVSSGRIRRNLTAIFALLHLSTDQSNVSSSHYPTNSVFRKLRSRSNFTYYNCALGSGIFAFFLSILSILVLRMYALPLYEGAHVLKDVTVESVREKWFFRTFSESFQVSVSFILLCYSTACASIFAYQGKTDNADWDSKWTITQFPFLKIILSAVFPAVCGTIAVLFVEMTQYALTVFAKSGNFTSENFVFLYQETIPYSLFLFPVAFWISFYTYVAIDIHRTVHMVKSLWLSLVVSFPVLIGMCVNVSMVSAGAWDPDGYHVPLIYKFIEEVVKYWMPCFFYLVCFAVLIEVSEIKLSKDS